MIHHHRPVNQEPASIPCTQGEGVDAIGRGIKEPAVIKCVVAPPLARGQIHGAHRTPEHRHQRGEAGNAAPVHARGCLIITVSQPAHRATGIRRRVQSHPRDRQGNGCAGVEKDVGDGQPHSRARHRRNGQHLLAQIRIVLRERDRRSPCKRRIVEHLDLVGELRRTGQGQFPLHNQLRPDATGRRVRDHDRVKGRGCRLVGRRDRQT